MTAAQGGKVDLDQARKGQLFDTDDTEFKLGELVMAL